MTDTTETTATTAKAPEVASSYDGATFEAMSPGPRKIVLAGMFHARPELVETSMTQADWDAAIEKFLAQTA